jgi:hypothetical protein
MRKNLAIVFVLFIFVQSCDRTRSDSSGSKVNVPEPLGGKGDILEGSSYRSTDLVRDLYNSLVKQDQQLKSLENQLIDLREIKRDSLEAYHKYTGNVNSYYSSASSYISQITDTILRHRIDTLLRISRQEFDKLISEHKREEIAIDSNEEAIRSLHFALMIMRTLPVMETYQRDHVPLVMPLQNVRSKQVEVLDTLRAIHKK